MLWLMLWLMLILLRCHWLPLLLERVLLVLLLLLLLQHHRAVLVLGLVRMVRTRVGWMRLGWLGKTGPFLRALLSLVDAVLTPLLA
jgi:hypothetical protein